MNDRTQSESGARRQTINLMSLPTPCIPSDQFNAALPTFKTASSITALGEQFEEPAAANYFGVVVYLPAATAMYQATPTCAQVSHKPRQSVSSLRGCCRHTPTRFGPPRRVKDGRSPASAYP
jgi:hypothetical protein